MAANARGGQQEAWRRRRNLRIGTIVAGVAVAVLAISVWPSGGDGAADVAAGPGTGSSTTLDTTPFTLLTPTGPTTIPDAALDTTTTWIPPRRVSTTTSTTTSTSTTTTTTIPTIPPDDPICQAFVELFGFSRALDQGVDDSSRFARRVLASVSDWIEKMQQLDPVTYAGAIEKLTDIRTRLRDRPDRQELQGIMEDLLQPDPRFAPLVAHRDLACPTVSLVR